MLRFAVGLCPVRPIPVFPFIVPKPGEGAVIPGHWLRMAVGGKLRQGEAEPAARLRQLSEGRCRCGHAGAVPGLPPFVGVAPSARPGAAVALHHPDARAILPPPPAGLPPGSPWGTGRGRSGIWQPVLCYSPGRGKEEVRL